MVPVRKFSTTPSAFLTSVFTISAPSGALRSSVMPRLLRLKSRYAAPSPSRYGGQVRDSSPLPVSSTLMTSAPRSASSAPHHGPAMTRERSSTRIPSRARGKGVMAATIMRPCQVLQTGAGAARALRVGGDRRSTTNRRCAMADLTQAEVRGMGRALGLDIAGDDLAEVTHRLNAFVEALASLGNLPPGGPEPVPAPVDPDRTP